MIDPILSLAFAMHANKGIYALLLGSGVSRAAHIPTGWDIVVDLLRKLAQLEHEDCDPDPARWYRAKFGDEPDYSRLLDSLAGSPVERQALLRGYFEPNEDERETGFKEPTQAHRAIAKVMISEHVRLVLTTNFDRLLERAIEEQGVVPTVLSTPDSIQGALPLVHQRCCIVKLHGDYLDPRIKNTESELAQYAPHTERFLDRILDEFGLIVCGWSGQSDAALYAAIERSPIRRFATYWATRSPLNSRAQKLITARSGKVIQIEDADSFFVELEEKVSALEEMDTSHPLSVAASIVTVKRLVADDRHRTRLKDLIHAETERAFDVLTTLNKDILAGTKDEADAIFKSYHQLTETIQAIMIHGCYWARGEQQHDFAMIIQNIARDPNYDKSGHKIKVELRAYPAVVLLYAGGIAALAKRNYSMFARLLTLPKWRDLHSEGQFLIRYNWSDLRRHMKGIEAYKKQYAADSDWLFNKLREPLRVLLPDDLEYDRVFDSFEYLRALVYADLSSQAYPKRAEERLWWAPVGRFGWKLRMTREGSSTPMSEAESQINSLGEEWGPLKAGLFDGSVQRVNLVKQKFDELLQRVASSWM